MQISIEWITVLLQMTKQHHSNEYPSMSGAMSKRQIAHCFRNELKPHRNRSASSLPVRARTAPTSLGDLDTTNIFPVMMKLCLNCLLSIFC